MGLRASMEALGPIPDNDARLVFLDFDSINRLPEAVVYKFIVRYQRYKWYVIKRFSEFKTLDSKLRAQFGDEMKQIAMPKKFSKMLWRHSDDFLKRRGEKLQKYMTMVLDALGPQMFSCIALKQFFEIGPTSFRAEMGRKGKEGFLQKSSGGYLTNFSSTLGDYFKFWNLRYVVVHDNHIAYYQTYEEELPSGSLQIDQGLQVWTSGRLINVRTLTRRLILFARTKREAEEWRVALEEFYAGAVRRLPHKHGSSYAPRPHCPLRVYSCGRDYFGAVTAALLSAQKEIYIASWMVSPLLWLTRPPAPPIRLDQLLKFKAEQGVSIFVLLYQEVEMAKQGNDSNRCKNILESLCPNKIFVIRHPNKLVGGSTALLWSHHEKIVVVDRTAAFVGGIDLAFGRYDDGEHALTDEDGWRFPGGDYYQPGEGRFNPVPPLVNPLGRARQASMRLEDAAIDYTRGYYCASMEIPATAKVVSATPFQETCPEPPLAPRPWPAPKPVFPQVPTAGGASNDETDSIDSVSDIGEDYQEPLQEDELRTLREAAQEEMDGQILMDGLGAQPDQSDIRSELPVAAVVYEAPIVEAERETIASPSGVGKERDADLMAKKKTGWNLDALIDAISGFGDAVVKGSGVKNAAGEVTPQLRQRHGALRDMFPRMPWHDIHAYVGGLAARDISSHFIQRWNHHRLSKGSNKAFVFTEITDNPHFGECAKCRTPNIPQDHRACANCQHDLGSRGVYFEFDSFDEHGKPVPRVPMKEIPPFIIYRCTFDSKLGCRIQGTGPVVVTSILDADMISSLPEGELLKEHFGGVPDLDELKVNAAVAAPQAGTPGDSRVANAAAVPLMHTSSVPAAGSVSAISKAPVQGQVLSVKHPVRNPSLLSLDIAGLIPDDTMNFQRKQDGSKISDEVEALNQKQRTLKPMVGDLLQSVNGVPVGHLDFSQVQRLILRQKFLQEVDGRQVQIVVVFKRIFVNDIDDIRLYDSETLENCRLYSTPEDSPVAEITLEVSNDPRLISLTDALIKIPPPKQFLSKMMRATTQLSPNSTIVDGYSGTISASDSSEQLGTAASVGQLETGSPVSPVSDTASSTVLCRDSRTNTTVSTVSTATRQMSPVDIYIRDRSFEKRSLICRAVTSRELDYRLFSFFCDRRHYINQDVAGDLSHSCQIQVLRSVGSWSIGQRTEKSVFECWRDTMAAAMHFIYIENQFFLSSLANGVQNTLAQVLLDKIVEAANQNRVFRAVVVLPLHPEGDFLNAAPVRHVMHYQYGTICRGAKSLIEQFKKRAPHAVVSDYINFFSLRNWGVLNGEVVTDQIYVHDKLLIVDDRVVVMGSANFNDRSMLGERDSEMAIRIEDTAHKAVRMNGQPFYVGALPHKLRVTLMRRHIGDSSADLSDPICVGTYYNIFVRTAVQNTNIYSALDGPLASFDRAYTLAQFNEGVLQPRALKATDDNVKTLLESVVGQLVMYPLHFLRNEDLGPSLASKTVVPTELWV